MRSSSITPGALEPGSGVPVTDVRRLGHDLNNLLTAIQGYGELVLEGLDTTDPMRTDMQELLAACSRAVAVARQLHERREEAA